jgi:Zn-dependent protease
VLEFSNSASFSSIGGSPVLLGEPPRTEFDLNFSLFGFPIRITPFFWLASLLLGWNPTSHEGKTDPKLLIAWCVAVLVSILIHELGHSFAFRYFGTMSHVVLYHFGGVAVPDSYSSSFSNLGRSKNPHAQIMISLAGPVAQMAAAMFLIGIIAASSHNVPLYGFVGDLLPRPAVPDLQPDTLFYFTQFFLYISVYWALINLLPVYPLDGGQIARELFLLYGRGDGIRHSLMLSVFTGGVVALLAFGNQDFYLGILFGMLAYSSYQVLQAYGGGYGGRW